MTDGECAYAPAIGALDREIARLREEDLYDGIMRAARERLVNPMAEVQIRVDAKVRPLSAGDEGVMTRWGTAIEALLTTYVAKGGNPDEWKVEATYLPDNNVRLRLKGMVR